MTRLGKMSKKPRSKGSRIQRHTFGKGFCFGHGGADGAEKKIVVKKKKKRKNLIRQIHV